ncbi:MAG: RagB/SusD family nutrient uptake outer membrane protein [Prolixibacteraceae bacterium]|nr:RagB/SusD family nutrient uptake outer membrane protein [Prolixibacteraceae bacterium]
MKKLIFFIVVINSFLNIGCKKEFTDLNPVDRLSDKLYYKTANDFKQASIAAYTSLRSTYYTWWAFSELTTDNAICLTPDGNMYFAFDQLTLTPDINNLNLLWVDSYKGIGRCNTLLGRIENVAIDENLKKQYVAEAKFLRALFYFNLVRVFGDVPLVVKEINTVDESFTYLRVQGKTVYEQIVRDLKDAGSVLPEKYTVNTDIGRATKGAAKSLLGKVYLTLKDYSNASLILKEVIDNASVYGYKLLPDYASIFDPKNGNNAEIVFSVQYSADGNLGSPWANTFIPQKSGNTITPSGSENDYNLVSNDLYNAFEIGDLRKAVCAATFISGGVTYYYTRKYLDNNPTRGNFDNDWIVIRYADVKLMYAEALNETNLPGASQQLNEIRARAGLNVTTATTQSDMRLAIEKERRMELNLEGHRWFDLTRTDRAITVLNAYFTANGIITTNGSPVTLTTNKLLFPIPFNQIAINPAITQNPGY